MHHDLNLAAACLAHVETNHRMRTTKLCNDRRQHMTDSRRATTHANDPSIKPQMTRHVLLECIILFNEYAPFTHNQAAHFCQDDAAPAALDKRSPHLVLKNFDPAAQRGLRKAERKRCFTDRTMLGNGH